MSFKTVLVQIDDSRWSKTRTACATQFANAYQAHLIGMTQTGISRFIRESCLPGVELGDLTPLFGDLREAAEQRCAEFDAFARQAAVASFEHRIDDEEPGLALAMQALYADLTIVGCTDHAAERHAGTTPIPEYVAINSPCPVLVLPHGETANPEFERVLVAWNASPEAARAVRLALPMLVRAKHVEIVLFDEESSSARSSRDASDMTPFLERHGVSVNVHRRRARGEVGNALLVLAEEIRTDLLVMGCYGHSRYREILLGGVSRTILRRLPVPVLLAH